MSKIEDYGVEDTAGFKNLMAIKQYVQDSRKMVRDMEKEVDNIRRLAMDQQQQINLLKKQLQILQVKVQGNSATT